jgi:hypothetical protein
MNKLWHIVQKDARRLWLPLIVWGVLTTLQYGADWWWRHLPAEYLPWVRQVESFTLMLFTLRLGVSYILAAALVMDDPSG